MLKLVEHVERKKCWFKPSFDVGWSCILYDHAEPGDPPNANYKSVRAKPLAKPVRYAPLTPEIELELFQRWHENRDERALEWLVGAHRPMVVRMAKHRWRGNATSLKVLVEYGMHGIKLAAEPPRPSKTKKGKMVGFDVNSGNRFSTYARSYADKEMRLALADDPKPEPERTAEEKNAVEIVAERWHIGESLRGTLDAPAPVLDLINRKAYFKPYRPWTLWHPTRPQRKPKPRNFIKHPRTLRPSLRASMPSTLDNGKSLQPMKASPRAAWKVGTPTRKRTPAFWSPLLLARGMSSKTKPSRLATSSCVSGGGLAARNWSRGSSLARTKDLVFATGTVVYCRTILSLFSAEAQGRGCVAWMPFYP